MAAETSCNSDLIHVLGQLGTWILVIVGWFIVNKHQNKRESRKEVRVQIDTIRDSLIALEDAAIKYHTNNSHDEETARKITFGLQRIFGDIRRLDILDKKVDDHLLISVRRAITAQNFDTKNHQPQLQSGGIILEIGSAIDDLTGILEDQFKSKFRIRN